MESLQTISGSVERIITRNESTSWSVLDVDVDGSSTTVVGLVPHVDEGLRIQAEGTWQSHPTFGDQFKAESVRLFAPVSKSGIARFLQSGAVQGIGKKFAGDIVSRFGEKTLDVIENDSWRLKHLKGVGPKRIEAVRKGVREYRNRMEEMSFLHGHLGPVRAQRVYDKYGDKSRALLGEDPYRLIRDLDGIGFRIADQVASGVGIANEHPLRLRAAVYHVLKEAAKHGHTCLSIEKCSSKLAELLTNKELAAAAVDAAPSAAGVAQVTRDGIPSFELSRFARFDDGIVERLRSILATPSTLPPIDIDKAVTWAEGKTGITFENSQRAALRTALTAKISIVSGGPGVGKTTILNGLLRILKAKKLNVLLAAPTGRASRRMSESTGEKAETIHKMLDFQPGGRCGRDEKHPLQADVVICDESSMIDLALMFHLLKALPDGVTLIIVGDPEQLPSVGAGQVLNDLIASGQIAVARLTEIFRQAQGSPIIRNAHLVNSGTVPDMDSYDPRFEFVETRNAEETAAALIQVVKTECKQGGATGVGPLCMIPIRKGVCGVENINKQLQEQLNPRPAAKVERAGKRFGVNDRVVNTRNSYELLIFNGDIGVIRRVDEKAKELLIDFDGRAVKYPFGELSKLDLAYCLTVHKCQGSQSGTAIIAVDTSSSILLSRKLVYTAITRAENKVILVGQKRAMHIAVSAARAYERETRLCEKLQLELAHGQASAAGLSD